MPAVRRAAELLLSPDRLLPACDVSLTNPLVSMNAREIGDPAYARWLHWCHAARHVRLPPVLLGHYPAGALLDGEGSFQLLADGALLAEQPRFPGEEIGRTLASLMARAEQPVRVDRPCLLACRYGEWTWGHWLLDMLPKIVMAEQASPQRFTYAVPFAIVDPAIGGGFARSVLDSLAMYGVAPSRLLRIHPERVYRFDNLFDVSGVSGKHLHPGILQALRDVPAPDMPRRSLTAILRAPPSIRTLLNAPPVRQVLDEAGAVFLDPLEADFTTQVAAFRCSDIVVGDLGSNLAAAIHARPGTGLVTLAPTGWQDDYFSTLFQRLDLVQADVRGVSLPSPGQPFHHAPYVVNPAHVQDGLAAIRDASAAPPSPAGRLVDGRIVPRSTGGIIREIVFGTGGNAAGLPRAGFCPPEADGEWTIGPTSRLTLTCPAQDGPAWLEIVGCGFVSRPHLVSRPFAVCLGDICLAEFDTDDLIHLHVLIPAGLLRSGEAVLIFRHPACPSPAALGVSADARPLGVMLQRILLRRLSKQSFFEKKDQKTF